MTDNHINLTLKGEKKTKELINDLKKDPDIEDFLKEPEERSNAMVSLLLTSIASVGRS